MGSCTGQSGKEIERGVQENSTTMLKIERLGGYQSLSFTRDKMRNDIYFLFSIIICINKSKIILVSLYP